MAVALPAKPTPATSPAPADADPRTRVLETAYSLFCRHGIQRIGIDRIVDEAGVAKMTLYRHFPSKEELVLAFLELRERRWTQEWLASEIDHRGREPLERLLLPFDVLGEWFRSPDFESCAFIRTLLEVPDTEDPVHAAAVGHLATVKEILAAHAHEAGLAGPEEIAIQLQILMMGAIVSATRGDRTAGKRARDVAERFLDNAPRA